MEEGLLEVFEDQGPDAIQDEALDFFCPEEAGNLIVITWVNPGGREFVQYFDWTELKPNEINETFEEYTRKLKVSIYEWYTGETNGHERITN